VAVAVVSYWTVTDSPGLEFVDKMLRKRSPHLAYHIAGKEVRQYEERLLLCTADHDSEWHQARMTSMEPM
jgi:hypothetical protein